MRRALGLLALLFLAAGAPLRAGTLRALDGRTGAGPLSWEGGTVAAATPQGPLRLSLDQLRLARFAEPAAETGAPGEGVPRRFTPAPRFGGRPGFVKAEYFLNRDLTEIRMARYDEILDQFWPEWSAPAETLTGRFSARFSARLFLPGPAGGPPRELLLRCDGGARLWLDGKPVLDTWERPSPDRAVPFAVPAGVEVDLRLEYRRDQPGGFVMLQQWNSRRDALQPVPSTAFLSPGGLSSQTPRLLLVEPQDGSVLPPGAPLQFEAQAASPAHPPGRVVFQERNRVLASVDRPPWSATLPAPAPGVHSYHAQAFGAAGGAVRSDSALVCVAQASGGTLPAPWLLVHFNANASTTTAVWAGDRLELTHLGGSLRATRDTFGSVTRLAEGDFELTARASPPQAGAQAAEALAGLFVHEQFRPGAPRLSLMLGARGALWRLRRDQEGDQTAETAEPGAGPRWLRVARRGGVVVSSVSTNGTAWRVADAAPPAWPGPVWVGFAACASAAGGSVRAEFDSILFTRAATAAPESQPGATLASGSFLGPELAPLGALRVEGETAWIPLAGRPEPAVVKSAILSLLLYRPVPPRDLAIRRDRAGLLLRGGDFIEGPLVSASNGVVTAGSVLFGHTSRAAGEEAAAVLLRPARPAAAVWRVQLRDGSVLRARSAAVDAGRLVVEEPLLGRVRLPLDQIVELERLQGDLSE